MVNWKAVTKAYLTVLQIKIGWKPNTAQFFVDITQRLKLIAVYRFIIYLFISGCQEVSEYSAKC